jgi:hypothetical protein
VRETAGIYFSGAMSEKAVAVISGEDPLKQAGPELNLELKRI